MKVLGLDIGGSKIAAGLVDEQGRVLRRSQAPTPVSEGRDMIIKVALDQARRAMGDSDLAGVGVGAAGVIAQGRVRAATRLLPDWVGTDLAAGFAELAPGAPVTAVNDVHAHGAGEAWCGAGSGSRVVLVVAVGTGLGGVVVHDGLPLTGAHGAAGHLGHIACAEAAGLSCSCGREGHLEAVASGYGIVNLFHALGGDPRVTTAHDVVGRLGADPRAERALGRAAAALGRALGDLLNLVDPDVVVLSGSVTGAGEPWWQQVRQEAGRTALDLVAATPIVPAALGADAGVVGAARLAMLSLGGVR